MTSSFASNDPESIPRESSRKRKRRKTTTVDSYRSDLARSKTKWRTEAEQRIYSSKLLEALRHVRRRNSAPATETATTTTRARDVKSTADRVLAAAAKGRTRWSRAILTTSRLRLNLKKVKKQKVTGESRSSTRKESVKERKVPAIQRKLSLLGRLVPGCRKLPFPNLLEETTDYISALEMQVRAMSAIAELLSGAGFTSNVDRLGSSFTNS